MRPSFESIYARLAALMSERSTCERLHVGAVITSQDFRRVLSVGYNGNASKLPNTCDSTTVGACGCLHAEENAIINCCEPRDTLKIFFVTDSPCVLCAKRIVNLGGVLCVYYLRPYRVTQGLEILHTVGIATYHLQDEEKILYGA